MTSAYNKNDESTKNIGRYIYEPWISYEIEI